MARGIDHLVIAVRDLEAARNAYRRLGFALTPEARHPFGTKNTLVQLDGAFLELVAVADPALIPAPTADRFSFAAFNRDFLSRHEGMSMLVLKSRDAEADCAAFAAAGLQSFRPLRFERVARGPDGSERPVAFTLAFTADRRLPEAGWFTCQHHFPANFWRAEYQRHANGARRVAAAVLVARDPADFHEFLTHLTGVHDMISTSLGIVIDTGDGSVEVASPVAYAAMFGGAPVDGDPRRFLAFTLEVDDLATPRAVLAANRVAFTERLGRLVVPAGEACGVAIAFAARPRAGQGRT
jgi:catechol 2,3-dioxygenase-like lactoylglutathione lyase family enzyme